MRKSLLASLVLGAIAAPAFADGTVTLYGIVNVPFEVAKTANGTQSGVGGLGNPAQSPTGINTPTRIGFKGDENLGDGMKAWWQIETGINLDDTTYTSGNGFANREGWVGLQGDFGKFGLGRGKTPYTNVADIFDSSVDGGRDLAIYKQANLGTVTSNRFDNAIRYDFPTAGGFTGAVMYGSGENKTADVSATKNFSANVRYANGPFTVAAAFNSQKNLVGGDVKVPIPAGAPVYGTKNDAFLLAGTVAIDAWKLGLGYQHAKVDTNTTKRKADAWVGTVAYTIDALTLKAGLIDNLKIKSNGTDLDDTNYIRWNLGAKYALSKRTAVYTEYTADDYKKGVDGKDKTDLNVFSIGLIHSF
ncbi:porin [Chitinimonas sp.]|uniref:porin n=1 Tax=Chitinimonas sp. TaxID=1934313 RepID=UPI002F933479